MSDPVSNADIEDVLSSIRRLVAGDKPEDTGASAARPAESWEDTAPDSSRQGEEALVLTPSLRVEETEEQDTRSVSEDPEADRWEEDGEMDREPSAIGEPDPDTAPAHDLESEPAEALAFSAVSPEEQEDAEDADPELPTFIRPLKTPVDSEISPDKQTAEPCPIEETDVEEETSDTAPPLTRPAPRAGFMFSPLDEQETESAIDDGGEEPEAPFLDASDAFETGADEEVIAVADADRGAASELEADANPPAAPQDTHLHLSSPSSDEVDLPDPWAPDLHEAISDHSEADEDEQGEAPDNLFASGAAVLDEDALREMVTEMLHKELRGALGERITRNVRKLVRREIHRALASRDFD
ncbi:hypothetical protein [Aliiruegeria sabulilitoris]|uniref:hypothetical protein n=1 Tax=Aliiruegeria sabulilitoris TaxID=1510458 RepID=UPI00082CF154|nr:hypothetical protein [Aliiruegeria sabulilitoris]NDR59137.1 hypothetical protein [Pseudoruegeria sp. M32A2M]